MAEIRKHKPTTSAIGDAVRAALGETVRPVTPGSRTVRDADDPYAPDESATTTDASTAMLTFGSQSGGWVQLTTSNNSPTFD